MKREQDKRSWKLHTYILKGSVTNSKDVGWYKTSKTSTLKVKIGWTIIYMFRESEQGLVRIDTWWDVASQELWCGVVCFALQSAWWTPLVVRGPSGKLDAGQSIVRQTNTSQRFTKARESNVSESCVDFDKDIFAIKSIT